MVTHGSEDRPTLTRRNIGAVQIFFFTVAASAPLTVLAGGVTTTYAITGNPAVALAFLLLAAALALFVVGYAAMSRHVQNAGAFYSYLANGLGRAWGVAGAFVALVAYNSIQIGLYGLFGVTAADLGDRLLGVQLAWWVWSLGALVVIAVLGLLDVHVNARVLAVLLAIEIAAVLVYDIVAFAHPAEGSSLTAAFDPAALSGSDVGAVIALSIAAFVGFESGAIYSEEARDSRRTVARGTYAALAFTGLFYALSAWAMSVNVGADGLQAAAVEAGPGLVFGPLEQYVGTSAADVVNVLFLTSVLAAMLSFHNGVARYLFALGRERVLPAGLSRISAQGAPVAGSVVQTGIALVVLVLFVAADQDPLLDLFTLLSGTSAVAVILLMTGTAASVVGYFRRDPADTSAWQRLIAPGLATVVLAAVLVLLVVNFDTLLGTEPGSPLRWALPAVVILAAVLGYAWALVLRRTQPDTYDGIGRSVVDTSAATVDDDDRIVIPPA